MGDNYNVGVNLVEGRALNPVAGISTAVGTFIGTFYKGPLNKATLITSWAQFERVFGDRPAPGSIDYYAVKGFFAGFQTAVLYVIRVASATATKATVSFNDQGGSTPTLRVDAKTEGLWGKRLAADTDLSSMLTTAPAVTISASATEASLNSIDGLEIGSDLKFYNGTNTEFKRITNIDFNNKKVYWSGGLTNAYTTVNGVITSFEFTLKIYLDNILVETFANLSMNNSVSFFCQKKINDVSEYVTVTDLKASDTSYTDTPAASSAAAALATNGVDGLSDITLTHWQGSEALKTGIYAMDTIPDAFRFCVGSPILTDADAAAAYRALIQSCIDYAYKRKTLTFYSQVPYGTSVANAVTFGGNFAARHIQINSTWGKAIENNLPVWIPIAPLVMAAAIDKDYRRGVHKSVGNEPLRYIIDIDYNPNESEVTTLVNAGINPAVKVPGQGIRVMGARTRSSVTDFKQLHYQEYWCYVGRSITTMLTSYLFETNDLVTRRAVQRAIASFLSKEEKVGALWAYAGQPAYVVEMSEADNTPEKVAAGIASIKITYVPVGTIEKFVVELKGSSTGFSLSAAA